MFSWPFRCSRNNNIGLHLISSRRRGAPHERARPGSRQSRPAIVFYAPLERTTIVAICMRLQKGVSGNIFVLADRIKLRGMARWIELDATAPHTSEPAQARDSRDQL